jgi:hypothetical protein
VNVKFKVGVARDELMVDVFADRHSRMQNDGMHSIPLEPYGWRWYRVGSSDTTLDRRDLEATGDGPPTARDPGATAGRAKAATVR